MPCPSPLIVGIDEVGRGPLAGPVVACACVAPVSHSDWERAITDSKALSDSKRRKLAPLIQTHWTWALGEASVSEIDALNIRQATFLAMRRALNALTNRLDVSPLHIMVDGNALIPDIPFSQTAVIGGDASVREIGAASIVAKVYRDTLMSELHNQFPHYGWDHNAGYGTATHMTGLAMYGVTPHHRTTFEPVKRALVLHQQNDIPYVA